MADQAWGKKRICRSCGAPFYDLKKKNIECPQCGAPFSLTPPAKPKRSAPLAEKSKPENISPIEAAEDNVDSAAKADNVPKTDGDAPDSDAEDEDKDGDEDGNEAEADEKDDKLIEDASDLGEDDDDMSEVKEHIDDGVEDKN